MTTSDIDPELYEQWREYPEETRFRVWQRTRDDYNAMVAAREADEQRIEELEGLVEKLQAEIRELRGFY